MIIEKSQTVLVVDDEPKIRKLIRKVLERMQLEVIEAENGLVALEVVKNEKIDLVISDVNMPKLSGIDLLSSIHAHLIAVPVILITGNSTVEAAVECMKIGAVDYISKPFKLAKITETIRKTLDSHPTTSIQFLQTVVADDHSWVMANYRVVGRLGEGNMGIVYLVEKNDETPAVSYALKILKTGSKDEEEINDGSQRFLNEIRAVSSVCHPNVTKIIDYGHNDACAENFYVMEYVEGVTLNSHLSRPLEYAHKARVLAQVADGLAAIHDANICHRDIKPSNILIDRELNAKIIDFGVAKMPDSTLTRTGGIVGSPAYMAPESFSQEIVDFRSDIFSLGILSYEFFTGKRPFNGDNLFTLAGEIARHNPPTPSEIDPDIPNEFSMVIMKMIEKKKNNRMQSAREVRDAFNGLMKQYE